MQSVEDLLSVATSEQHPHSRSRARTTPTSSIDAAVDGLADFAVVSFAIWTVLYHVGLIFTIPTNPLLFAWFVSSVAAGWWLVRSRGQEEPPSVRLAMRSPAVLVAALAAVSAMLAGSAEHSLWWPAWIVGLAVTVIGLAALMRDRLDITSVAPAVAASRPGTLLALGTALGLGAFSVFTLRSDPDDTFYVNRAVWVAQHGTIPTRDTMFSSQTLHALPGAGIPVQSIEAFQGAIAHVFSLAGGTAAYLLTPPVGTFLAVWSIWRLVRSWAPRRWALCFATAVVYLLWAAGGGGNLGVFFLARMQQGKVIFVAMLVPAIYVYLTEFAARPTRRGAVLLTATGMAAVGFSSSATFIAPLICVAAAAPLLLRGLPRRALGLMLPAAYPILVGLVVHFSSSTVDNFGVYWSGESALHFVFGTKWFAAIGWLAVFAAVLLARNGAPRLITWGIGALLVVLLMPGMFTVLDHVTGAHAVLWRVMWVAPLPVLVGLLAAVPLPRIAAPVPAVVVIVAVIVGGLPLWSGQRSVAVQTHPTWRYSPVALRNARAIIEHYPGAGPILAPDSTMRAVTLSTTRVHAVDPLRSYVNVLVEPAAAHRARLLLSSAISGISPMPSVAATRAALRTLQVAVVCVQPSWTGRAELFQAAGYGTPTRVGGLICRTPSG